MAGKKRKELTVIVRPDGKTPAAAYLRVSSNGQDVENSIDAQLEQIRRWAENNGYVIVKVFTDRAKTGRFANRPDFQEMIETAESNNCPFSAVLVWRFSRFFRDRIESATYKQRLRKKNVRVISINEPTDDTPEGRLLEGVLEVVDQHHSDMTAVDVQRGTHNLAQRGFFVGARAPFGMKRIKVPDARGEKVTERNKLAPDQNAWIVRRVFDLSLQGKSDGQIHRVLRNEGLVMPSGKPWYPNRIHDILTNRHYEGTIVWGAQPDGTWTTVCEKAHEGIVTPAEFTEVSRLRKERSPEVTHPRYAGSEHMLSQLGTCKQCGQSYTYRAGVDSYLYIMCKTRRHWGQAYCDSPILPAALFEAMTLDVVDNDILLRHNLELAMDQLRENSGTLHTDKAKRAEKIRESVADYDRRIENAYLAWENEDIEYEFFTKRTEELRTLKATAMEELQKLEEDLDDTYVILNNPEAMLDYSAKLKTFLRDEQPTSARLWLRTFLKKFWVEKGYVTYEYKLPLPPDSTNSGLKKHTVPLDFDPITRPRPGQVGIELQIQPGRPSLQPAQHQVLHRVKAQRPQVDGIFHRCVHLLTTWSTYPLTLVASP